MKTNYFYVLTREVNDYRQYGEYFVAVYNHKPTKKELIDTLGFEDAMNEYGFAAKYYTDVINNLIDNNGGRLDTEQEWYNLHKIEEGKKFD